MELYAECGFDKTTVSEIAERAGLTERTFFRYFADKREVLFSGQEALLELVAHRIAEAPPSATPMGAVGAALRAVGEIFPAQRREHAAQRQAVIALNPGLQERELIKLASMAAVIADALQGRGCAEGPAKLTGEAGVAVFKVAFERWITDVRGADLAQLVAESFDQLRVLAGE